MFGNHSIIYKYKPQYGIWCESHVLCAQDPSIQIGFMWEVLDPVDRRTNQRMDSVSLSVKFQVCSYLRSDAIVFTSDGRKDRHSSNVLELRADQMSLRYLGSQINISMRPTRIDKTNIPSARRV